MQIKVFKFGGASVKDSDGFKNVADILDKYADEHIVIVVSALGKTTNALESVVSAHYSQDGSAEVLLNKIRSDHFNIADLLIADSQQLKDELNDIFVEIDWILEEAPHPDFDYTYDQVVSAGELLSTRILSHLLKSRGLKVEWLDVRDIIQTDNTFRDARILWDITQQRVKSVIGEGIKSVNLLVTQGFIGSTSENFTTTLGREGSDYTAAILSYCLDAESMHIWKDVPGVLTGDPTLFEEVSILPRLSYNEAIEMTYYGAKVIHPKTIKPLQNKHIPMYVRPFTDPSSYGTLISDEKELSYPPIVVIEANQALLHISTNDFSFVAEHHMSMIFSLLAKHRIKVNMMRNTAISFTVCVNQNSERIKNFETELGSDFRLIQDNDLELITIRHYNESVLNDMKTHKLILFEEKLSDTAQIVVRNLPKMRRKE